VNPPAGHDDAADRFIAEQQDPASPNYHHWLSAEEYGSRFGAAAPDINTVTAWLRKQGLAVNVVYPGGLIDISGSAGTVADAFRTEIHTVSADGVRHIANLAAPQAPRALASAVAGDFGPAACDGPRPAMPAWRRAESRSTPGPRPLTPWPWAEPTSPMCSWARRAPIRMR
jgi:hypothetical protein